MELKKMKINYNDKSKLIEIDDSFKTQYWLINTMLIFTIINSILFLFSVLEKKQLQWVGFIWVFLGIASLIILIYQISKKSAAEKIKLNDIISFNEKCFLGRKKFSLKLKNGKYRDLLEIKNETDIMQIKQLFKNNGIEVN